MKDFDVVIATDLRFPGGSSGSTLEEVFAQFDAGLSTALYHLPASVLIRRRPFHSGLLRAVIDGKATLLNRDLGGPADPVHTKLLIVRHPSVIGHVDPHMPAVTADRVLLVVNHPPINAVGRIDYILPYVKTRLERTYSAPVDIAPIGPLVRTAIDHYYGSGLVSEIDWPNIFNLQRFAPKDAPQVRDPIVIGRHSRPGPEKWPNTKSDLLNIYPDRDDVRVRVLGGTAVPEAIIGRRPGNWESLPFGAMPAEDFLKTLDVFVYYHHPNWVEAFGRVIAEAMATALPVVVPPHFRSLFGDGALYAAPEDVPDMLSQLGDQGFYAKRSEAALAYVRTNFSPTVHLRRLANLGVGQATEGPDLRGLAEVSP